MSSIQDKRAALPFSCMPAPLSFTQPNRWIAHEADGQIAGEFSSEYEAKTCTESWNNNGGDLVTLEWTNSAEDADESDRGTYVIRLSGTRFSMVIRCGWHSQDVAVDCLTRLRNAVVKYGFTAVSETLFAGQHKFSEFGWTN